MIKHQRQREPQQQRHQHPKDQPHKEPQRQPVLARFLLTGALGLTLALGTAACGGNATTGQNDDILTEPGAGVPGSPQQDVTTPDSGPGDDADDMATGATTDEPDNGSSDDPADDASGFGEGDSSDLDPDLKEKLESPQDQPENN